MLLPNNLKTFSEYIQNYSETFSGEELAQKVESIYIRLVIKNERDLREVFNKKQSH